MARVVSKAAKRREQQGGVTGTEFGFDLDEAEAQDAATAGLPPDWLTSGVAGAGAGWVFGPVGGLIGLTVAAVLSKRRRDGIMAQVAADIDTGESMLGSAQRQLDEAMSIAKTDQDRAEIAMRQEQLEQIAPLMQHPSPQVRLSGFQSLLQLGTDLSGEMDEIEKAQLDREAVNRDENVRMLSQFETISDDFRKDSRAFESSRDNYLKLQGNLTAGTGVGDMAGIFSFMKMLDPISTVREGEVASARNTAGVDEGIRTLYNGLLKGDKLSATQRTEFINRASDIYGVDLDRYLDQEERFIEEAQFNEIPDELIDTAKVPFAQRAQTATVTDPDEVAEIITGEVTPERKIIEPSIFARGVQQLSVEAVEFVEEIGRMSRNELVVEEGGRYFVEDRQGNVVREIDAPNDAIPDAAKELTPEQIERDRIRRKGFRGPIHPIERRRTNGD